MSSVKLNLRRVSNQCTRLIGTLAGESFPFYYVTEHPRSGGTWVAHMISDYLQVPLPEKSIFPLGCRCVIHNTWPYNKRLNKVIYVVRDGRDVAVSMFFYVIRHLTINDRRRYCLDRYRSFASLREDDYMENFNKFLDEWLNRAAGTRLNWPNHVSQWAFGKPNVKVVKYEDMQDDCMGTMKGIIKYLTGTEPDLDLLQYTVNKFSFQKQTGRQPGQQHTLSAKRKGIVGDWKNYFNSAAQRLFNEKAGAVLERLHYE